MSKRLRDKIAIITGAARGIGACNYHRSSARYRPKTKSAEFFAGNKRKVLRWLSGI